MAAPTTRDHATPGSPRSAERLVGSSTRRSDGHGASRSPGRRLRASAGLPSGRAALGGLLIALSALGVVAAWRGATDDDHTEVLIVNAEIAPGERIEASDLAWARMDLADPTLARAVVDPDDTIGAVALVALRPGDLLTPSVLAEADRSAAMPGRSMGLSLPLEQALGGRLSPGDRVDVVALAGSGRDAEVLVRDAIVADVSEPSRGGIGSSGSLMVLLNVATENDALAIVDADSTGGVTLVRARGDDGTIDAETAGTAGTSGSDE